MLFYGSAWFWNQSFNCENVVLELAMALTKVPPRWPLLEIRGSTIVLCEGATLSRHHLFGNQGHRRRAGEVEARPGRPGHVVLSNLTDDTWTVTPVGEGERKVRPGQRLGVRPMAIDFGPARGLIRIDDQDATTDAESPSGTTTQLRVERR